MPYAPHETVSDAIRRAGLPQTHEINWTKSRKAQVVRAVRERLISFDEACWRYLLSRAEFRQWEKLVDERPANRTATRSVPADGEGAGSRAARAPCPPTATATARSPGMMEDA